MSDTTAETAREAWAILVGLSLAQRRVWLEAGMREGLTPPQAISLMRLQPDAPPSLGDLARHMHCDASYATALADRLEERGLVERYPDPEDRRGTLLRPTDAGRTAFQEYRRQRDSELAALLEPWPPEDRGALIRLLGRLNDDLERGHAHAASHAHPHLQRSQKTSPEEKDIPA